MEWYHYALIMVGLVALAPAIGFAVVVRQALITEIATGSATLVNREDIPEHLRIVHEAAEGTLLSLGFEYAFTLCIEEPVKGPMRERWIPVYINFDERAYAEIVAAEEFDKPQQWHIEFNTAFSGGKFLATVDGVKHRLFFSVPWLRHQDTYNGSLSAQWQNHRDAVARLEDEGGLRSQLLTPQAYLQNISRYLSEGLEAMRADSKLKRSPDGAEHLRFKAALSYARQLWRGERRRAAMLKQAKDTRHPTPVVDGGVQADVEAYLRRKGTSPKRKSSMGKAVLFGFSLLAFSLALGLDISMRWLAMIAGVVLFHELGHILGMYLFKYRDLQILFIPFFGAAAVGTQRNPKVYQRVIIDLLGPVPGVIVGLALLIFTSPSADPTWTELGLLMLFLNYLNLLPIMPLDGGHVMNLILSGYHRYYQLGFQLTSVAVLGALAWTLESVIFGILALVLLTLIPTENKKELALRRLQGNLADPGTDTGEHALMRRVFTLLREPPFSQQKADSKYYLARFLEDNAQRQQVTATSASVVLLVYAATLTLPVAMPAMWSFGINPASYMALFDDSTLAVAQEPLFGAGERDQLNDIELRRLQHEGWHAYLSEREQELLSVVSAETGQYVDYFYERNPPAQQRGATAAQLAELEINLGTQLPSTYREFLLARDGWLSIALTMRLANSQDVQWLRDADLGWVDEWVRDAAALPAVSDDEYYVYGSAQDEYAWRRQYLRDALLVSDDKTLDDAVLLIPKVRGNGGEWEAWVLSWSEGSARRYPSFAHMIAGEMVWAERQLMREYPPVEQ